ncbi:MAG: hypothetical protein DRN15_08055 [Thermoprotei archaeon]|nr:MAG: hypothetical protein DRN15_08055 [Thermoprotei archaeon]
MMDTNERFIFLLVVIAIGGMIALTIGYMEHVRRSEMRRLESLLERAKELGGFDIIGAYMNPGDVGDIEGLLDRMKENGVNLIIVFVNPRGQVAYYPSKYYKFIGGRGEDPLARIIDMAHERGIKVWAWFDFMGYKELLERHPDWAAVYPDGKTTLERPYYEGSAARYPMNPLHPEVKEFWKNALLELVTRYDIDGVNFEDDYGYCYGGENYSYDDMNRKAFLRFALEHNVTDVVWPDDVVPGGRYHDLWIKFKCHTIAELTKELYQAIKSVKPHVVVSIAVAVHPWQLECGVDWRLLAKEGCIDALTFMLYSDDTDWVARSAKMVLDEFKRLNSTVKPIIIIGWELRDDPPVKWLEQAVAVLELGYKELILFDASIVDSIPNCWSVFKELRRV